MAQLVKNLPAMWETWVHSLGWEDSPGEGKGYPLQYSRASLVAQMVKNPLAIRETWVETIPWRPELPTDQRHPRLFGADLSNTLLRRSESI